MNLEVTLALARGSRDHMEDNISTCIGRFKPQKKWKMPSNSTPDKMTRQSYAYFALFDGHSGEQAAVFAKQHLLNCITRIKDFWSTKDDLVLRAIKRGFLACNALMLKAHFKWPKRTFSGGYVTNSLAGSTATVAFVRGNKLYTGHIGDSALVLGSKWRNDAWKSELLTVEHKPNDPVEKRRIYKAGGKVVRSSRGISYRVVWRRPRYNHRGPILRSTPMKDHLKVNMSRAFGDFWSFMPATGEYLISCVPDVSVRTLDPHNDKVLVFGSDGLFEFIRPAEIVSLAKESIENGLEKAGSSNGHSLRVQRLLDEHGAGNFKVDNPAARLVEYTQLVTRVKGERMDNCSAICVAISPSTSAMTMTLRNGSGDNNPTVVDLNEGRGGWRNFDPKRDHRKIRHDIKLDGQEIVVRTENCRRCKS